ncbi:restriction endonuclease subunit S [bacterium LRH843]|nr:restriction endonuclease subunit S [bacterium LRH843]
MGFNFVQLGAVAEVTKLAGYEYTKHIKYVDSGEIIAIRALNVKDGFLDLTNVQRIEKKVSDSLPRSKLYMNEIVLTYTGSKYGDIARIEVDDKYHLAPNVAKVTVKEEYDSYFYYLVLQSPMFQSQLKSHGVGSSQPTIPMKIIRTLKVPLPSIQEQRNVSKVFKGVYNKIELNNQIISNLEQLTQTLFKRWFVDFEFPNENGEPYKSSGGELVESELGRIPPNFKVEHLSESVNFLSGGTPKTKVSEYWNGKIPFFTPKDITGSVYVTNTQKNITELGLSNCNSKLYPKNTLFLTARGTVGKLNLSNTEMAMNQSCFALQHKENKQYYLYFLVETLLREIIQGSTGAVFNAINLRDLNSLKIVSPTSDLIEEFSSLVTPFFEMLSEKEEENISLKNLRDTLLPKLLSGEIELPDETEVTENVPIS